MGIVFSPQAAEKQVSQLRKERDAAQSRVEKAERGLESLDYDKAQEDGLAEEKDKEEKAVESLREVNGEACILGRCDLLRVNGRVIFLYILT